MVDRIPMNVEGTARMSERMMHAQQLLAAKATRRRFLTVGGAAAALALASGLPRPGVATAGRLRQYPFALGVASGDPLPDGVVLWTRLAPQPLAPFGGMDYAKVPVRWEVALDERCRRIVRRGVTFARPELSHSVHVDVKGLQPGREYYYRFAAGGEVSPVGRTKTAPAPWEHVRELSIAYASCQVWYEGYYTALADLARNDLDVVFHVGDYIYEYGIPVNAPARAEEGNALPSSFRAETVTLDQYRERYSLYKSDPDLQEAHRVAPWIVTLDDHEVENNWADEVSEGRAPRDEFLVRRANAFRAYWENMPLRLPQLPQGPDIQLYRRFRYGDLAEFSVLDTRQYRSDQAAGDGTKAPNPESQDPARTITGDAQEQWLLDGLGASRARWNVIPHQTAIMRIDTLAGPAVGVPMDTWDGYEGSRDRILGGIDDRRVENVVFLSGDLHRSLAADLKRDFDDPDSPTVAVELVGTSITSGRDGEDNDAGGRTILAENPWIRYGNFQRGYVRAKLTPDAFRAEFRVAPFVTRRGAELFTRTTLVVEDGVPGLQTA
jgi:phosphodiesterase/alkaline phosphatase D-like protein